MTINITDDTLRDILIESTVDSDVTPSYTVNGSPWVTGSTISALGQNNWANVSDSYIFGDRSAAANLESSGRLSLQGANADIEINGQSLTQMLRRIEERINILTVNTELESEWDELRELGDQYRALEQHIKNKMETWNKLRAEDRENR